MIRIGTVALIAVISAVPLCAQSIEWGVKAGVNSTSVASVPEYYDWLRCCDPLNPAAMVESTARRGFVGGAFIAVPITGWVALQGDVLLAQRRHFVDLEPYENNQITFERDYVDTSGLVRLAFSVRGEGRVYVAGGPAVSFRVGEGSRSFVSAGGHEPTLQRLILQFGPFMEAAKSRDVSVLAGFRF